MGAWVERLSGSPPSFMETVLLALKLTVALGILNVWVVHRTQSTAYRGQGAKTLREEFAVYGLPGWVFAPMGFLKVGLAGSLLLSIWVPAVTLPAASLLGAIMVVAFAMHLKVSDPAIKSLPSLAVLAMCVGIALL